MAPHEEPVMADREIDIAKCPRGPGREVRFRLCEWQGRAGFDIREWNEIDGQWRPGKGVRLRASELGQAGSALDAALERIDRQGRIVGSKLNEEETEMPF